MIDLTDIERMDVGDEVFLFGDGNHGEPSVDEIANVLGTINYEILCILSKRVPRAYIKNNEVIRIRDYLLE
jgi:alanine racemase